MWYSTTVEYHFSILHDHVIKSNEDIMTSMEWLLFCKQKQNTGQLTSNTNILQLTITNRNRNIKKFYLSTQSNPSPVSFTFKHGKPIRYGGRGRNTKPIKEQKRSQHPQSDQCGVPRLPIVLRRKGVCSWFGTRVLRHTWQNPANVLCGGAEEGWPTLLP